MWKLLNVYISRMTLQIGENVYNPCCQSISDQSVIVATDLCTQYNSLASHYHIMGIMSEWKSIDNKGKTRFGVKNQTSVLHF